MQNKKLNIAFVVDKFGSRWGGAESYGVELMRVLSRTHNVTVFASNYDTECDLKLNFIPLKSKSYWPSWYRVMRQAFQAKRLTASGYDIVHSHNNGFAGNVEVIHVVPVRYNWRVKKRSWHKHLGSFFSIRVLSYLWLESKRVQPRKKHKVIAVSPLIAQQLQQAYKTLHDVRVITPGVNTLDQEHKKTKQYQGQKIRAELGFSANDFVSVLVARNPLRKGLITAMKAYKGLNDKHKMLVVGSSPDIMQEIKQLQLYKDLQNQIVLVPNTSDVFPYYYASNICIHPTLNDSFAMAPLEAMSCGLPVVISPMPWCGFSEYLEHNKDALILKKPDDWQGLNKAIKSLEEDKDLYKKLQDSAYDIAKNMSWESIANQYELIYYGLLN